MTVKQLITVLHTMPPDARVVQLWDGSARTTIELVWLARDGTVVTADFNEKCYQTETRPKSAPTQDEEPYWQSPGAL